MHCSTQKYVRESIWCRTKAVERWYADTVVWSVAMWEAFQPCCVFVVSLWWDESVDDEEMRHHGWSVVRGDQTRQNSVETEVRTQRGHNASYINSILTDHDVLSGYDDHRSAHLQCVRLFLAHWTDSYEKVRKILSFVVKVAFTNLRLGLSSSYHYCCHYYLTVSHNDVTYYSVTYLLTEYCGLIAGVVACCCCRHSNAGWCAVRRDAWRRHLSVLKSTSLEWRLHSTATTASSSSLSSYNNNNNGYNYNNYYYLLL